MIFNPKNILNIIFLIKLSFSFNYVQNKTCIKNYFIPTPLVIYLKEDLTATKVDFLKFESFDQVNPSCFRDAKIYIMNLNFRPKRKLFLPSNFNFQIENVNEYKFKYNNYLTINFLDILGFSLNSNLFISSKTITLALGFFYTNLAIKDKCLESKNGLFKNGLDLKFAYTVRYSTQTCPFLFKNSNISTLYFYGLTNTFIRKNILEFLNLNITSLNSTILNFEAHFYQGVLNKNFFDKSVYENTLSISLIGSIKNIENFSLSFLKNVQELNLDLGNFAYLAYSGSRLFNSINATVYLLDKVQNSKYSYPTEDFCFFKDLYLKNVCILNENIENCSCTLQWILKDSKDTDCSFIIKKECYLTDCNFTQNIRLCNELNFNYKFNNININPYDILFNSQWIDFIGFILIPLLGSFGVLSNLLCIKVLMNKKNIEITNRTEKSMYNLMLLNSWLGFFYCLIYLIHLINKCVEINGIFCSSLNRTFASQVYDIYIVRFMGSILKLLSSLISIKIAFNRLNLLVDQDNLKKEGLIKKYTKVGLLIFTIILIFLINIYYILTSRINTDFIFALDEYSYIEFPIKNKFFNTLGNSIRQTLITDIKQKPLYTSLFQINFILNDIVFLFLMSIFDIILLYNFNSKLKFKKMLIIHLNFIDKKKKLNRLNNSKFRTTFILTMNTIIMFGIRLIHFCACLFVLIENSGRGKIYVCEWLSKICTNYLEASEILFLISSCYNICVYYFMNKNFREEFKRFLSKIWNKISFW